MYNPTGSDDYEFVELKNVGRDEVKLSSLYFEGIRFAFPFRAGTLAPGEMTVLVRNHTAFAQRYPKVPIGGIYDGQLSNQGETLTLRDGAGREIFSVTYDDEGGWPLSADGRGDSLRLINLTGDPNQPQNWRAGTVLNGSPGE